MGDDDDLGCGMCGMTMGIIVGEHAVLWRLPSAGMGATRRPWE